MKRLILTYGIIGGIISTGGFLSGVIFTQGGEPNFANMESVGWVLILLSFVPVVLGMRKAFLEGYAFSFGQQFKAGLLMTCILASIYSFTWVVYMNTDSGQQFVAQMWENEKRKLEISQLPEEELAHNKELMQSMMDMYENPILVFLITFIMEPFPPGLLISLLNALYWGQKGKYLTKGQA